MRLIAPWQYLLLATVNFSLLTTIRAAPGSITNARPVDSVANYDGTVTASNNTNRFQSRQNLTSITTIDLGPFLSNPNISQLAASYAQPTTVTLDQSMNQPLIGDPYDGISENWKHWRQIFAHYRHLYASARDVSLFADAMLVSLHNSQVAIGASDADEYSSTYVACSGGAPMLTSAMTFSMFQQNRHWTWQDAFATVGMFRWWARRWQEDSGVPSCHMELFHNIRIEELVALGSFTVTGTSGAPISAVE